MIQYLFDGEEHAVMPAPHGNTKQNQPSSYVRTKCSMLKRVREMSQTAGPKETYLVSEESGGYILLVTCPATVNKQKIPGQKCRI